MSTATPDPKSSTTPEPIAPLSVMVVEPFSIARRAMVEAFAAAEHVERVWSARDGAGALKKLRPVEPDVIVLALDLPDIEGLRLLDRLLAESKARVLVYAASERQDAFLDALRRGAAGYLTTRATATNIAEAVQTVARGWSVVDTAAAIGMPADLMPVGRPPMDVALARREQQVLRLVAEGLTDKEIGASLYISPRTVQNHLARIRSRTGTHRRSEIARWAVEHEMV